jgi:hypothetical protein
VWLTSLVVVVVDGWLCLWAIFFLDSRKMGQSLV